MNPGPEKCEELYRHFGKGTERPLWSISFPFEFVGNKVLLEGKKLVVDKQKVIRGSYFDPRQPSTIEPMFHAFRTKYCNISKRNIRDGLMKIPTYQLVYRRSRPKDLKGVFNITQRGYVAFDLFFSSTKWATKYPVLAIFDVWSRFCHITVLERKTKVLTHKAIELFLRELTSRGIRIIALLHDKGSEFQGLGPMAERYKARNIESATGKPILAIEALNSVIQRRLEPFLVSGITDDVAMLCKDVQYQLNRQPVRGKNNHTPVELISMREKEANSVFVTRRDPVFQNDTLPPLEEGDYCRYLTWTRKEQVQVGKKKGYEQKWSVTVHRVEKARAIKKDIRAYRYKITGVKVMFFRHELLKIPPPEKHDNVVPSVSLTEHVFAEEIDFT